MSFLKHFPSEDELLLAYKMIPDPASVQVNGHIHSPYSFSAFPELRDAFDMARNENISVLGINDFFVTDGYQEFCQLALEYRVFPLFNIEFIGLLKQEQSQNIRINDPNNPGRIYFSGKGLDNPSHLSFFKKRKLNQVKKKSQEQIKHMILKVNQLLSSIQPSFTLEYAQIKAKYARELVRERHIAKALRILLQEATSDVNMQKEWLKILYGGKESVVKLEDINALENEIRNMLLKAGGRAFVPEKEDSFLPLDDLIQFIRDAGGIPCYPVLLDDKSGFKTEFERDYEALLKRLKELNVYCIELIPGRNDINVLEEFVNFFSKNQFIITFGTEHNTPELIPLKVKARENKELSSSLLKAGYEGTCILAAHQYLRAKGHQGYIFKCGTWALDRRDHFISLGNAVIQHFLHSNLKL